MSNNSNGTLLEPMMIKQEIDLDEDEKCILYISQLANSDSLEIDDPLSDLNSIKTEADDQIFSLSSPLTVKSGNITNCANIIIKTTSSPSSSSSTTSSSLSTPTQTVSGLKLQSNCSPSAGNSVAATTATSAANNVKLLSGGNSLNTSTQQLTLTAMSLHQQQRDRITISNNNAKVAAAAAAAAATFKKIEFAKLAQSFSNNSSLDLLSTSGSLEHSPSPSPLSFGGESHPQEMFCSSTVAGDSTTPCLIDSKGRDSSPKRLCLVCGDTASGFHYGVASCEACKAFFKRTIQGNIEYTCPATNNCEINKRRRKACQACRFQKCLRMGMLKEGVRLDRVRGGRQKYRARTAEAPYQTPSFASKKSSLEENRIVAALINCEPEPITMGSGCGNSAGGSITGISSPGSACSLAVSSSQYKNLSILSDLVDKELVATIGWAKQIPGFTDLTLNDQMRLLQSTWTEILALSLAFRSHQYSSPPNTPAGLSPSSAGNASSTTNPIFNKLVFASDFILDDQQAAQCNAEEFFSHIIHLVKRLHQMKIAKEEYLIMKALILSNADIQLENWERVQKLRENLLNSLQECVSFTRPQNVVAHLTQLLLAFPLLRQIDSVTRRLWVNVLQEGSVPMNKLFVEMLESNSTF